MSSAVSLAFNDFKNVDRGYVETLDRALAKSLSRETGLRHRHSQRSRDAMLRAAGPGAVRREKKRALLRSRFNEEHPVAVPTRASYRNRVRPNTHRFGIELEVVVDAGMLDDAIDTISEHFQLTHDITIKGGSDAWYTARDELGSLLLQTGQFQSLLSVEFVYKGTFSLADLDRPSVSAAFNAIAVCSVGCAQGSCGTHVHMSDTSVTLAEYPLFREYLGLVYHRYQQDMSRTFHPERADSSYAMDLALAPPHRRPMSDRQLAFYNGDVDAAIFFREFFAQGKYAKLNFLPGRTNSLDDPVHVEFRALGEIIKVAWGHFPFDALRAYLNALIYIWERAKREEEASHRRRVQK